LPRALVTGGAGFIGSHLADRLISEGFEVNVLDDFSTGCLENIKDYLNCLRFRLIRGDVRRKGVVREALRDVDYVFHLAAIASVPLSMSKPKLVNEVNVSGTLNLLWESLRFNVKRFIFTSSCAVYGEPAYMPIDEEHPINPVSPYAASKISAEHYCKAFHKAYGLETVILRLFNVYGPRQERSPYSGVIAKFIDALKSGRVPTIFGDGEQTRDFIYVDDVVDALILASRRSECAGMTFNIGSGIETSINQIAYKLIKIFGLNIKPTHLEPRVGDVRRSCANINKARDILGFRAKTPLEVGLEKCAKEYLSN
jgi:nucleoside-diphosphate-sugar epimerase